MRGDKVVSSDELLIAIDAGHGGWDNGASWNGRLEKDDNLRLALEVQKQLLAQGIRVLMTRDTDVYVTLSDRAAMANQAGADLFVSLHRNSYIMHTPTSNGVENFIYLTAPWETAGRAAQDVLDQVVSVGVQSNRGVQRGNYYVVRRTIMPAMLLEMGFIIDEIDNQLFDEHLVEYAAAIAKGIMVYFGLEFQQTPGCSQLIMQAQQVLNQHFGLAIPINGVFDATTRKAAVMALQMALNNDFGAGLAVDGILGPKTMAAFPNVFFGHRGNVVLAVQILVQFNGYDVGGLDGIFGAMTQAAVKQFQSGNNLNPDGVVGQSTLWALAGN
jgi:N-acetylmuramoyl-L-alanine amidase